jgi:FkbM family methyltransferase
VILRMLATLTREYLVRFPVSRGKGVVKRNLAPRLPVRYREVEVELTGGGSVVARFDEWLAIHYLREGHYDPAELQVVLDTLEESDTAIDVGANVGVYTVTAARAVGPKGRVIAVEADVDYLPQLEANVARNGLANVEIVVAAAGSADGTATFNIAADRAFSSTKQIVSYRTAGETRIVPLKRVDTIWHDAGEPRVALLKIDVEGAEVEALHGAERLVAECKPVVLVEVTPNVTEPRVREWFCTRGYRDATRPGFSPANRCFVRA